MDDNIMPLKQILDSFLENIDMTRGKEFHSFFSSWQSIAGEDIASHSKVIDIKDTTLLVEVDHPGWMQILRMREHKILLEIQKKYKSLSLQSLSIHLKKAAHNS